MYHRVLSFLYRIRIFKKVCSYLRIQISRATAKNKSSADESKSLTIEFFAYVNVISLSEMYQVKYDLNEFTRCLSFYRKIALIYLFVLGIIFYFCNLNDHIEIIVNISKIKL